LTRRSSVRNRSGATSWLELNVCKVAVAYAVVAGRVSVVMANEEKTKLRLEIAQAPKGVSPHFLHFFVELLSGA